VSIVQILEMSFNRSRSRRILPGLVPQRAPYNTTELTDQVEPPTFHVFCDATHRRSILLRTADAVCTSHAALVRPSRSKRSRIVLR
jgi:hypothetical protein